MLTETIQRDKDKGRGKREMIYSYCYTDTTRMTPVLRQAAVKATPFNVLLIARDKVTRQCPQTNFWRERKAKVSGIELRSFCLPAWCLTAKPAPLTSESVVFPRYCICSWSVCRLRMQQSGRSVSVWSRRNKRWSVRIESCVPRSVTLRNSCSVNTSKQQPVSTATSAPCSLILPKRTR